MKPARLSGSEHIEAVESGAQSGPESAGTDRGLRPLSRSDRMRHSAPTIPPPPRRVMGIQTTAEGGGFVVTCQCRWLRFYPTQNDAAEGKRLHVKKCKTHKAVGE